MSPSSLPIQEGSTILVTGGAGYIGSHTCKALAKAGYQVVSFDNLVYGHKWAVKWGPLETGDINDRERLEEVIHKYRPSAVMHFAAYAYVRESIEYPDKYYNNNVVGSLTLLEIMRDHKIDKIIFSSSCAIYGLPHSIPIREGHPQNPISPYGASKLMIERILQDFGQAYGIRSISLRYFNAAGADPNGEIGEDHTPETHLIPLTLEVAVGHRTYLEIFGDDYDTPDGTCIRDYIHICDIAEAHLLALHQVDEGEPCKAYNLGNGQGFSIKEVVRAVTRVTGREIPIKIRPRRLGDPPQLVGDATKAIRGLGWQPRYPGLEEILETAWRWHQRERSSSEKPTDVHEENGS